MQIIEKSLAEITPYANNPRLNDIAVDSVAASIQEFGFKVPIIIDGDGTIIAGHTRMKAALRLGMETVPCILADDLTPEQARAFRLADNKVSELAGWDMDLLGDELAAIDLDMTLFGFEDEIEPDLEDIDTSNESTIGGLYLSIDDTKVPMTEEEKDALLQLLDRHVEQSGVTFGFVRALLDG